VLLVDDHRQVLDSVSAMLSDDFKVAGVATDGRQALDLARQVRPDVVVLDVDMPGFDGFQTLRALEQGGMAATPVVFLSMHDTDEIVSEAFRCGGRGYVLKTRVARDLVTALDQALLGRLFVPSLESLSYLAQTGGHAMQVHGDGESFLDGIAAFFDLALQRGDATCVIASSWIREGLTDRLRTRGWDAGGSSGHKRCLSHNRADALNRVMRTGTPDPIELAAIRAELDQYRRAVCDGPTSRLILFGDMVMSLRAEGKIHALLTIEREWTRLTQGLPFLTLCAYTSLCFHQDESGLWSDVCTEHWAVSHATDV
jgi:CheY-like chemotaxis protein